MFSDNKKDRSRFKKPPQIFTCLMLQKQWLKNDSLTHESTVSPCKIHLHDRLIQT